MILYKGTLYDTSEQDRLLSGMEEHINCTRRTGSLDPETVIAAVDTLAGRIKSGEFDKIIRDIVPEDFEYYVTEAVRMLSRDNLEYKLRQELGGDFLRWSETDPPAGLRKIRLRAVPLGTLFHIAAGNMDILPAFTVAEGLLTGNVNVLKLPQADSGLTVLILQTLIEIEPRIAEFIYVFDTPSTDIAAMQKMAAMADGIVVWGGDAAVTAVRALASPGAKIIEWGHRLSFAYVSGDWRSRRDDLQELAEHIVKTKQLLCSSCQTVFVNTDDPAEVHEFCRVFLPYMESAGEKYPVHEIGEAAELTLRRYAAEIEGAVTGIADFEDTYRGSRCCLKACTDSALELSDMFGSCPVKPLPESELMTVLRQSKGYLQTAGLICDPKERERLTDILIRCGVNRVTAAGNMSETFSGEPHDGEYSMRRYVRTVAVE